VVLFKRRASVFLLASVVVGALAIGLWGAVGSASPDEGVHNDKGRTTLTVLVKNRELEVVDLGPRGPSQGDMRVVNAPLYDESAKERIGRLDFFCVTTDPADEPSEKAHMAECTKTFTLQRGEISVQGVNAYPKLSEIPPHGGVDAISGGTGKYAGARGEERFETRGNKVISTFHFVD
jgi:hypothetical protein